MTEDEFSLNLEFSREDVRIVLYALETAFEKWPGNEHDPYQGENLRVMRDQFRRMNFEYQFHSSE